MGKQPIKKQLGRGDGHLVREQQNAVAAAIAAERAAEANTIGVALAALTRNERDRRANQL